MYKKVHPQSQSNPECDDFADIEGGYESDSSEKRGKKTRKGGSLVAFDKWHGMSEVVDKIAIAIDSTNSKKGKAGVNGWAILSAVIGVEEVFDRMEQNINLTVLVSGLLLNSAIGLVLTSPPSFDSDNSIFIAYVSMAIASIGLFLFCILLSIQFLQSLHACARDSDRWRVILTLDMMPTYTYIIFTLASLSFVMAIGLSMIPVYGEVAGYMSSFSLILVCGLFCYMINRQVFLKVAHVKHGWYEHCNSEYDMAVPFGKLLKLAAIDREYKRKLMASTVASSLDTSAA